MDNIEDKNKCPCGSGEHKYPVCDGYGIFMHYACSKCENTKNKKYRSDIFEHYQADEPIEAEAY
jgi:CDGSH-type Zn-finger protein